MTREEYYSFREELIHAEKTPLKDFEEIACFESCMPIEDIAQRGEETLVFGPMKPVGLINPETQKRAYAIVQLRKENTEGTMYNIVGFQTKLSYTSQKRIFRMIPGLKNAEFLRYGSIHRNTFIDSPKLLLPTLKLKNNLPIFLAGQITGVEGYIESAATGLIAGINAARYISKTAPLTFPDTTSHGALIKYITSENKSFQPMHINFGLFTPISIKTRNKSEKRRLIGQRALHALKRFLLDKNL